LERLHDLARRLGICTEYRGADGKKRRASPEALRAVLRALGLPIEGERDLRAISEHLEEGTCWEPVRVAWEGFPVFLPY